MKHSTFIRLLAILCLLACFSLVLPSCQAPLPENPDAPQGPGNPGEGGEEGGGNEGGGNEGGGEEGGDSYVTYTVTVVDGDGNPLAGAAVQLCVGDLCKLPQFTDASGVALFEDFDPADYTVKVTLSGYTGEDSYHFAEGATELTVTLTQNPIV